jgi:hypothetical protein
MRAWIASLALVLGAGTLIVAAIPCAEQLAASRRELRDSSELALFPSGRFLREASLGHAQLAADIGWLTAIQYYGKHRRADRHYPLAPHLFATITDADPQFENAYFFGSLVLAEGGFREQAERLLRRGAERNPHSWGLRFELGFYQYVIEKSYGEAAAAFMAAAQIPGAPEYVRRFAAAAHQRSGDAATARLLWDLIARESDNEEIRRMARARVASLEGDDG